MTVQSYGLLASPPVRWLIAHEPDVRDAIKAFLRDESDRDHIDVAGPPNMEDVFKARPRDRRNVPLPTIRLTMRKVDHHLTGEPGVEVTCSDLDCDMIVKWHNQAKLRASFAAVA